VSVCPKKILEIDKKEINSKGYRPAGVIPGKQEDCIGCLNCATMCPDNVISVFDVSGDE
jgi:2-oxoglutarate ferredoxin oxidoreductase subunit delta